MFICFFFICNSEYFFCRISSGAVLPLNITTGNTALKWNSLLWEIPHIKLSTKKFKSNQSLALTHTGLHKTQKWTFKPNSGKNVSSTSADVPKGGSSLWDSMHVCVLGPDETPLAPTSHQDTKPSWALHSLCLQAHSCSLEMPHPSDGHFSLGHVWTTVNHDSTSS